MGKKSISLEGMGKKPISSEGMGQKSNSLKRMGKKSISLGKKYELTNSKMQICYTKKYKLIWDKKKHNFNVNNRQQNKQLNADVLKRISLESALATKPLKVFI